VCKGHNNPSGRVNLVDDGVSSLPRLDRLVIDRLAHSNLLWGHLLGWRGLQRSKKTSVTLNLNSKSLGDILMSSDVI
jgi:hypothetical protein